MFKAAINGIIATVAMEVFYRLTDLFFKHEVDFAFLNGTTVGLNPEAVSTRIVGYIIVLFGGVLFSLIYEKFVSKKNVWTGIIYSVGFAMVICAGLIVLPLIGAINPLVEEGVMVDPGFFGLGLGLFAGLFSFLGHVVFGAFLGLLSHS